MKKEFNLFLNGTNDDKGVFSKAFRNIKCDELDIKNNIDFINKEKDLFIKENNINPETLRIIYITDIGGNTIYGDYSDFEHTEVMNILHSNPLIIRVKIWGYYSEYFITSGIFECINGTIRIPMSLKDDYYSLSKISKVFTFLIGQIYDYHPEVKAYGKNADIFINWDYAKSSEMNGHDFNKDILLSDLLVFN